MRWTTTIASFDLLDDHTSDPIVTSEIVTPTGNIQSMADVREFGRSLVLHRAHIRSDAGPNAISINAYLRVIAKDMAAAGGAQEVEVAE